MNQATSGIKKQRFVQLKMIGQTFVVSCILFIIFVKSSIAQTVIFDEFPIPAQLYQRDDLNIAQVNISGRLYTEGFTDVSVLAKKDKKDIYWKKQKLVFQNGDLRNAPFLFQPVISAGLVEYEFYFYAHKGSNDSVLVKMATQVLCGDNIVIYGQSNAQANITAELEKFTDEFKFGRTTSANFEIDEYYWIPTFKWNYSSSGLIGLEIQRQLIEKYKIPIGIINRSVGNTTIGELMIRNENNHEDIQYYYGQLLKLASKTGLAKTARMFIWRQGESDAFNPNLSAAYPENFKKFRNQVLEDFPAVKKMYIYQNNIYFGENNKAGDLRDYQRRIGEIYPDCEAISTVGTLGFEGLHYSYEGYLSNAQDVSRLIAKDFMNSTDTLEIYSPNIRKAYFTSKRDSLILEFDKDQKMSYPDYSTIKNDGGYAFLKNYIYLDDESGKISGGQGVGNKIVLKLSQKSNAKRITYCPDYFSINSESVAGLPYFKNSRGLTALTFKNFPLSSNIILAKPELTAKWNGNTLRNISLEWVYSGNLNYTIEKSVSTPDNFVKIATLSQGSYLDFKVKKGVKYYYRLNIDDDVYSNIAQVSIPIETLGSMSSNDEDLEIYPNPVSKGSEINVNLQSPVHEMVLSNNLGNIVKRIAVNAMSISISTSSLTSGTYLIEAISTDQRRIIKKIIID